MSFFAAWEPVTVRNSLYFSYYIILDSEPKTLDAKMYIFLIYRTTFVVLPAGQVGSSAENTMTAQAGAAHWELGYS
jgi:hypothetical protein